MLKNMDQWLWFSLMLTVIHGRMMAKDLTMEPCLLGPQLKGIIDVSASTQIGLRTYNDSAHGFEILTSPWIHRHGIYAATDIVCQRAEGKPVYLSFDIDGFDPALRLELVRPLLAVWQVGKGWNLSAILSR